MDTDPDGPVKVYALMVRQAGLSDEQFHAHWREPHGRLAMQVRDIRRYVQAHTYGAVPNVAGWPDSAYDGLPAVWFDSLAAARALHVNPEFQESHADEMNLVDRDRLGWVYCTEHIVAPGTTLRVGDPELWTLTLLLRRLPKTAREEFDRVVDIACTGASSVPAVTRVTYALPRADDSDLPLFDAIVELSSATKAELESMTASQELRQSVLAVLAAVTDVSRSELAWTYEERWLWPIDPGSQAD